MSIAVDLRRKELLKLLLSDPMLSLKEAMIKVGYSPTYAETGGKVVAQSKSFVEKLNEAIGDDSLLATMKAIMNRREVAYLDFQPETKDDDILDEISKRGGEFPKIMLETRSRRVEDTDGEPDMDEEEEDEDRPRKRKRRKFKDEKYQMKVVKYYVADEAAVDRMFEKIMKIRGDYAPEKKKIVGIIGITQLLDELQDDDGTTVKPGPNNGEPQTIE